MELGNWWLDVGRTDENSALEGINAAIDSGINFIDTADLWLWPFRKIVGKAIKGRRIKWLLQLSVA